MNAVRVLVVDDHEMVADGLVEVLGTQADIDVVGQAGTVRDALRLVAELSPTVVLMDYRLPDGDGLSATTAIREQYPDTAVIMVTASSHETVLAAAVDAGCAGYVTKDRAARDVVSAVTAVARGDVAFPASALRRPAVDGPAATGRLSPRELQVLQRLADGRSTQDIADEYFLSVSTVRNHIQRILGKLGVHSKLEAASVAVREGLVSHRD